MTSPTLQPRLLVFDVFGTVVDWRSSIAREVARVAASRSPKIDAAAGYDLPRNRTFQYVADNFEDLAGQLGA
jgi:hypothetical protein